MILVNDEPITVTKFPDGTSQVWKLTPGQMRNVAHVEWRFESESEVMHLAQLSALFWGLEIGSRLDIRCLPYARQDKEVANDRTFALRSFAPILNSMRWGSVTLHDPHSPVAVELIERSVPLYYTVEARRAYTSCACDLLCLPDAGALAKYGPMFAELPQVHASKVRDQATGAITGTAVHGVVRERRVLIVDDICDGGATFIGLASALRENGALFVALFVSHGIFSKGTRVLFDSGIDRIFTPEGEVSR